MLIAPIMVKELKKLAKRTTAKNKMPIERLILPVCGVTTFSALVQYDDFLFRHSLLASSCPAVTSSVRL